MYCELHFMTTCLYRLIRFAIDKNRGFSCDYDLFSIHIPDNAVDRKVKLMARATAASDVQMNPCSFGEVIVSDIVEIEKTGVKFKNPATLTIKHSVFQLPDHSSIVIKAYQCNDDTWIALNTDESMFFDICPISHHIINNSE